MICTANSPLPRGAFRFGLILAFLALAGAGKVQAGDRLLWRPWGVRSGLRGRRDDRFRRARVATGSRRRVFWARSLQRF
jgi:hypothetical protein